MKPGPLARGCSPRGGGCSYDITLDYISKLRLSDTAIKWPWLQLPVEIDQALKQWRTEGIARAW